MTREYYAEGELVPGSPAQPYYYGPDQIGTVRRAFASTSSAPAYGYDPYGNPLQTTAPVTDFVYAGMFYNADSGLYLTQYRAYDPAVGRWLSRDPLGESRDPGGNLYAYVGNDPLNGVDPTGLATLQLGGAGSINLPFGLSIPLGFGVAIDTQGHVGLYSYAGGGAQVGANVEAGLSIQVSNAKTISDLTGPFFDVSGHAGVGVGGSVDYFTGSSANGPVTGGGVTLGAAAGASVSGGVTNTWLCAPFGSGSTPSNPPAPTPGPTFMQPSPASIVPVSTSPGLSDGSSLSSLGTSSSLSSK